MNKSVYDKIKNETALNHTHFKLDPEKVREFVKSTLQEDISKGDLTSNLVHLDNKIVSATLISRHQTALAGMPIMQEVFNSIDPEIEFKALAQDGDWLHPNQTFAHIKGKIKSLFISERVALNILQHLCGIATAVHRCVDITKKYGVKVVDTRKTLPLMRHVQKYAVTVGGGLNHRYDLSDGILIKDNHINAIDKNNRTAAIKQAVDNAKKQNEFLVEIEVESIEEAKVAVEAGADVIMLDNMSPEDMATAVKMIDGRALIEASGGITLKTLEDVAKSGIDFISIGRLTHSVHASDISMEIEI